MPLILNPDQPYGKQFNRRRSPRLLDGSLFQPPAQHTIEEETRVLLGQPSEYPDALVAALSSYRNRTGSSGCLPGLDGAGFA